MPTPFPGMDPFLEHPGLWPDVHNRLVAALADDLGERLPAGYYARLEERTYLAEPEGLVLVGRPDLTVTAAGPASAEKRMAAGGVAVEVPMPDMVRETWLEVRSVGTDEAVTVVEILSPANKRPSEGRRLYERKRMATLGTLTHLVEVDLLRAGEPMPVAGAPADSDYRILVSRADRRPRATLYPFSLRDPIPPFVLPLRGEADEPEVDLGGLLHRLYDRARYGLSLDYAADPVPPVRAEDREWVDGLLRG